MALLTSQKIDRNALAPTYAAAAVGGDTFIPDDRTFLHVKNASGGAITVTVAVTRTLLGLAVSSLATSVPAGGERMIGPFPPDAFRDLTGQAAVTYSGVTSLTIAAVRLSAG